MLGAHVRDDGVSFAVWAPNARAVAVVGDFNDWQPTPLQNLGESGIWEAVVEGARRRAALQVPGRPGGRHGEAEGRSVRVRGGGPAAHRVDRPSPRARVGRRRVGRAPARVGAAPRADVDLRGPPRLLAAEPARGQPLADVPGAREGARRLRGRSRVHARRADADPRASVLRFVGLSGDRLLRADLALRLAGRLPLVRRLPAPARARRDPRLGARALPARRLGAGALRRHRALRARRPAPRRAPGLGHARLQLLAARGAELPARVGAVLAARVPRRRPARRRRRVDALPRLLAARGRVGAERVRRARGPRRGLVPEGAERGRAQPRARCDLGCGGVDGVARRLAADVPRRARVRLQVEHGVDARHARLLPPRPDPSPLSPPPAHVLAHVRVQRELRPSALARRGRAREGLAALEDARRPLAAVREPALALRVHVGAPRQEAALHGRRARAGAGVVARPLARLAPARAARARGHAAARARRSTASTASTRRSGRSTTSLPASAGSSRTTRRGTFSPSRATGSTRRRRSSASATSRPRCARATASASPPTAAGWRC